MILGAYRRTGADPPFGDPARAHGVAMEGSYWRFTDVASGRVVVVLCGACRAPDGPWAVVGVASHPGGFVRWRIVPDCALAGRAVRAGDVLDAAPGRLRVRLDGASVDATWSADVPWPRRRAFGGLGPAQSLPGLGQYWHPLLPLGTAVGGAVLDGAPVPLDGATVYAEKNWGPTFAGHWWWGQAHGLGGGAACVAFAGGRLLGQAPTALVVALEDRVLRFAPPLARVVVATAPGRWRVDAADWAGGCAVSLEAEADPAAAVVLPVPVPAERRVIMRSAQHLAGRLAITVRRGRRVALRGESELAGLERGVPQ